MLRFRGVFRLVKYATCKRRRRASTDPTSCRTRHIGHPWPGNSPCKRSRNKRSIQGMWPGTKNMTPQQGRMLRPTLWWGVGETGESPLATANHVLLLCLLLKCRHGHGFFGATAALVLVLKIDTRPCSCCYYACHESMAPWRVRDVAHPSHPACIVQRVCTC